MLKILPFLFFVFITLSAAAQQTAKDYFRNGNEQFKAARYAEAIQQYDEVLRLEPRHAPTLTNRGVAKDRLRDYRGAIEDFTRAIAANKKYAEAYLSRGLSRYNMREYKAALQDLTKGWN
jgi:tetratricopeptide (TPR) repeat protein